MKYRAPTKLKREGATYSLRGRMHEDGDGKATSTGATLVEDLA
jgi:hypothetical protein